ncbi:MAG: hypothetical protein J6W52_06635 [Bacteroidaceae bacterium]|nr:hypothetical protein [Bacteroidaceae bacterium]
MTEKIFQSIKAFILPFLGGARGGFFLFIFLLMACEKPVQETFSHESVQQAAQHYYMLLIQGEARQFVEGMSNAETFTEDYKEQMQNVIAQAAKGIAKKGGVVRVEALSDTLYVADSTAYVFLDLVFADSIHEQIGLPMVFQKGVWRMK